MKFLKYKSKLKYSNQSVKKLLLLIKEYLFIKIIIIFN